VVDPYEIVRQFLAVASNSFLTFLGGSYFAPDALTTSFDNTHKAVVYHQETGALHVSGASQAPVFVFKCYGGTMHQQDARAVGLALIDYMHPASSTALAVGWLMKAELVASFKGPDDPAGWPVYICKFRITTEGL